MTDLETRFQQAVEAHRRGDLDSAEPVYRQVLADHPAHAEAQHMLGVTLLQRGRLGEAETAVQKACTLDDTVAKYHNTLGNILNAQGQPREALEAFEAALACDPAFSTAACNKGTILLDFGRPGEAESVFRAALAAGADLSELNTQLATALIRQNRIDEAIACCREGLVRHPGDPALRTNLASALELSNDLPEAEVEARTVCESAPGFPMARLILARVLRRLRQADKALEILTPLLDMDLGPTDRIEVLYEQGLILDVLGSFPDAFAAFSRYNALQAQRPEALRCDAGRFLAQVRDWSGWVEAGRRPPAGRSAGEVRPPVFFVGFPRSGTTLVEQALMSHPDVVTTEEISPLGRVEKAARDLARAQGRGFPGWLDSAAEDDLEDLRRLFASEATRTLGDIGGRTLVDKLPLNIVLLGLVERLWPDARILVALRDPRDACLSCFIQKFSLNDAMAGFLDIETTGTTYAEVMGLWLSYRDSLSLPIHEYRYEDLVEDFETTIRTILDFIGVGWHDEVSRYREAAKGRVVKTPSYREVTAPVHQRAVYRWTGYKRELEPVLPLLTPFVQAFGYEE